MKNPNGTDVGSLVEQPQSGQEVAKRPVMPSTPTLSLAPTNMQEALQAAEMYANSSLVPERFQGKRDDCFVAIQLAARQGVDPTMLMQNSYVVHGTPGIAGKYAIALMNAKGPFRGGVRFTYERDDKGAPTACTAHAIHRETGERCESRVGMEMVVAEGWIKNTKWKSMPEQMLAYRSGAFLARLYCPEVLMGMQTVEELQDVIEINPIREEPSAPQIAQDDRTILQWAFDSMDEAAATGHFLGWWDKNKEGFRRLVNQRKLSQADLNKISTRFFAKQKTYKAPPLEPEAPAGGSDLPESKGVSEAALQLRLDAHKQLEESGNTGSFWDDSEAAIKALPPGEQDWLINQVDEMLLKMESQQGS